MSQNGYGPKISIGKNTDTNTDRQIKHKSSQHHQTKPTPDVEAHMLSLCCHTIALCGDNKNNKGIISSLCVNILHMLYTQYTIL